MPAPNNQPEVVKKPIFAFGPPPKRARQNTEDVRCGSIKDEFLLFFEAAIKNERDFAGFWAINKKVFLVILSNSQTVLGISNIYTLSKKLLSAPASTGSVERLFS